MTKKVFLLHALYKDDEVLLDAIKNIRKQDYEIEEVYTPFPVHGLEKALGLKRTRIAIAAFLFGILGFFTAIAITNYTMIVDWPQNFGGKPNFSYIENVPAFVTILFELTVFFAAHLMVITFYLRSRLWPWKKAENPYPSSTDDTFVVELEVDEKPENLEVLLEKTGAFQIDVTEKIYEHYV